VTPGQGRTLQLQASGVPETVETATGRECGRSRLSERIAAQLDDLVGMLAAYVPDDCTMTVHAQLDEQGVERPFIQLMLQLVVDPVPHAQPWPAPQIHTAPLLPPPSAVRARVEDILGAPVNATQLQLLRETFEADGRQFQARLDRIVGAPLTADDLRPLAVLCDGLKALPDPATEATRRTFALQVIAAGETTDPRALAQTALEGGRHVRGDHHGPDGC
jgi:hypothetical protein